MNFNCRWGHNSAIYHAVSSTGGAAGPYVDEKLVVSAWAHSPRITHAPDGTFLLWHVGCGHSPASSLSNCTNGTTPGPPPSVGPVTTAQPQPPRLQPQQQCKGINAMASRSIHGPWTPALSLDLTADPYLHSSLDDPAPLHLSNGSTWIIGRSWNDPWPKGGGRTPMGVARSVQPSWNSTYVVDSTPIPQFRNATSKVIEYIAGEDDFVWIDKSSGTYHLLFHSMEGTCSTRDNEAGCHAFSLDGHDWYLSQHAAYNSTIQYVGGATSALARRERPLLVFDSDGAPAFMLTANQDSWASDHTYTHMQPIVTKTDDDSLESSLTMLGPGPHAWQTATPEAHGLSSAVLAAAAQQVQALAPERGCLLVVKDGVLVHESYGAKGGGREAQYETDSLGKTYTAALLGVAVQEGLVDIDKPIASYGVHPLLPNLWNRTGVDYFPRVTTRHLLAQMSGYGLVAPGTLFSYDSDKYIQHLSFLLRAVAATPFNHSALAFARIMLAEPLGVPRLFDFDGLGANDISAGGGQM